MHYVIDSAPTIAGDPGAHVPASRALAARRLREMASPHRAPPNFRRLFVQHLESFLMNTQASPRARPKHLRRHQQVQRCPRRDHSVEL